MSPDPITAEEYFRGTLKTIAHWSEVDLSGEWETGLRGVIRSITDMAKEVLSAHPETNPGAAKAEPATVVADLDGSDARPNRRLDSSDRGHFPPSAENATEQEGVTLQICFDKVVKDRDHLREVLSGAHRALVAFKDAVIASDVMKGREYVGLGIQVNDAIDKARIALSSEASR